MKIIEEIEKLKKYDKFSDIPKEKWQRILKKIDEQMKKYNENRKNK